MQPWVVESAPAKYGGGFLKSQPADPAGGSLAGVAGPSKAEERHAALDPRSPLLWFGVLAAVTVGLMSYSTSVKVGPVSAAVKVG